MEKADIKQISQVSMVGENKDMEVSKFNHLSQCTVVHRGIKSPSLHHQNHSNPNGFELEHINVFDSKEFDFITLVFEEFLDF